LLSSSLRKLSKEVKIEEKVSQEDIFMEVFKGCEQTSFVFIFKSNVQGLQKFTNKINLLSNEFNDCLYKLKHFKGNNHIALITYPSLTLFMF
jgi:hypothetical protein